MKRILLILMALLLALLTLTACSGGAGEAESTVTVSPTMEVSTNTVGHLPETSQIGERFPLYAEIPAEGLYLYGIADDFSWKNGGWVLYHTGKPSYFDWEGYAKYDYPMMAYGDYDKDGNNEIAIIITVHSGTGILQTDLHMLKVDVPTSEDNPYQYTDHILYADNLVEMMQARITIPSPGTLLVDGKEHPMQENVGGRKIEGAYSGWRTYFEFDEEGIWLKLGVDMFGDDIGPTSDYIGEVTAKVNFDGENFSFGELTYEEYKPLT